MRRRRALLSGLCARLNAALDARHLTFYGAEDRPDSGCYFGIGSRIVAFSGNDTSPALPSIRYWIFNCLTALGSGSPPKRRVVAGRRQNDQREIAYVLADHLRHVLELCCPHRTRP